MNNALEKLRKRYELSSKQLASYLDIDQYQIEKLLEKSNLKDLSISFAELIASKFEISLQEFVDLDDNKDKQPKLNSKVSKQILREFL